MSAIRVEQLREFFPALGQKIYDKPLIYFDNAATTLKPVQVIDEISRYYREENSNIHRAVHYLAARATERFEEARAFVRDFLNAQSAEEIIFVRGTTEAINLVAQSFLSPRMREGDEVIVTQMEHHSNLVPWQMVCHRHGGRIRWIPMSDNGCLQVDQLPSLINDRTRFITITHVSNVLGTINPIKHIVEIAHHYNIPVLVDGAQAIVHMRVDVQELDCDFYCFSGHKIYGPMGIGVLYGKKELLEQMEPYQGGGEMIKEVHMEYSTYNDLPFRFEAGTPHVAGALGLHKALQFVQEIGYHTIHAIEDHLLEYALEQLKRIERVRIIGTYPKKTSVISFIVDGIHHYDLGVLLDKHGIAVRTGHHCAQPLMKYYGIPGTVRISFGLYNTSEEVDNFADALQQIIRRLT